MKRAFVIDWILIPIFLLTLCSGVALHIAGHGDDYTVWHNWAVFHIVSGMLFLIVGVCHIKMHWGWYKGVAKKGLGRKSRITLGISLLFFLCVVTGMLLLGMEGGNTGVGLWHYRIGLFMGGAALIHIFMRFPVLRKSLEKKE